MALKGKKTLDEVLSCVHKQLRQDVRRQNRRLEALGPVRLRVFKSDETTDAKAILPDFEKWLDARWPRSIDGSTYFSSLIDACLPEGYVHVSCLYCGDRAISAHVGFLHRHHFYYYKPAYDVEYSQYSPGKVHLAALIESLLHQNVQTFDFLRGCEPYKLLWTKEFEELYSMEITPPGLTAALAPYTRGLIPRAIRKYRRIRLNRHRDKVQ